MKMSSYRREVTKTVLTIIGGLLFGITVGYIIGNSIFRDGKTFAPYETCQGSITKTVYSDGRSSITCEVNNK